MDNLTATQARASAPANDSDAALPDGDVPSRRPLYRLQLEKLHRYVASYTALAFTPLLRSAFRVVPISVNADATQMRWGDWAKILSSISDNEPLFLWS